MVAASGFGLPVEFVETVHLVTCGSWEHTSITSVQSTVLSSTINLLSVTQRSNKFKPAKSTILYIALLLLATAEDVETNPGPSIDMFSQSGIFPLFISVVLVRS